MGTVMSPLWPIMRALWGPCWLLVCLGVWELKKCWLPALYPMPSWSLPPNFPNSSGYFPYLTTSSRLCSLGFLPRPCHYPRISHIWNKFNSPPIKISFCQHSFCISKKYNRFYNGLFLFLRQSQVAKAGLKLIMYRRANLNFCFSCLPSQVLGLQGVPLSPLIRHCTRTLPIELYP